MFIANQGSVENPIVTPHGEIIYELIGRSPHSGKTAQHSLAHIVIPPGKSSVRHHHNTAEESYYILKGKARLVIEGQEASLSPGQACLIRSKEAHQIFNAGDTDLEFLAICAPAWTLEDSWE